MYFCCHGGFFCLKSRRPEVEVIHHLSEIEIEKQDALILEQLQIDDRSCLKEAWYTRVKSQNMISDFDKSIPRANPLKSGDAKPGV
jgi:hypothetical protein